MSIPAAPKLDLLEATETTISVEFKAVKNVSDYELQWKSIEQNWGNMSTTAVKASGKKCAVEAHDLTPGTTYCIRLVCVTSGSKGSPGPELIIDTEQVGCTPKTGGGGCCVIQ